MNIKRVFFVLAAALLMPGLATAGATYATFEVDFHFADNNPAATTAYISCDGGLPNKSDQQVTDGVHNIFVVEFPESPNDIDCRVWVDDVTDYTTDYTCYDDENPYCDDYDLIDDNADGPGCFFTSVDQGDNAECEVDLNGDDAHMTITKTWDTTGNGGSVNYESIDLDALIVVCTNDSIIEDGSYWSAFGKYCKSKDVSGPSDGFLDVTFYGADWEGDTVYVYEWSFDSSVEVDVSDCVTSPGNTGSYTGGVSYTVFNGGATKTCTIDNTVFYEGIPTLNQYGMAIMALLMLGIGFVGFRRFV